MSEEAYSSELTLKFDEIVNLKSLNKKRVYNEEKTSSFTCNVIFSLRCKTQDKEQVQSILEKNNFILQKEDNLDNKNGVALIFNKEIDVLDPTEIEGKIKTQMAELIPSLYQELGHITHTIIKGNVIDK